MSNSNKVLNIDIVSDVVCPWCIIGYKQFEKAVRETAIEVAIHWHPFELNPQMPDEGENLREHLAGKYGTTLEDSIAARARLTGLGEELDFTFNYTDDMMMYNTYRAHQLLHWAGKFGRRHELKLALFEAFFTHRRNISDPDVLVEIAGKLGLDQDDAIAVLNAETFAEDVRNEEQFWMSQGVTGVPAIILDRAYLVTGAQGVANYVSILNQVTANRAA